MCLWSSTVCSLTQKFVPLKKHCFRPNSKPWYSPLLRKIARLRDRLFNRSKGRPATSPLFQSYKKVRNGYVSDLRKAKLLFYRSLSSSITYERQGSQGWWAKLKAAAKWSCSELIPPLSLDGILCLSSDNKAVALNTAFSKQCSAPSSSFFVPATFVLPTRV